MTLPDTPPAFPSSDKKMPPMNMKLIEGLEYGYELRRSSCRIATGLLHQYGVGDPGLIKGTPQ